MHLLSHPFRLSAGGTVATVEDGTVAADAEGVAIMALTRRGERDQLPTFGIPDPAFDAIGLADLNVGLADYGPAVTVVTVTTTPVDNQRQRTEVTFARSDDFLDQE